MIVRNPEQQPEFFDETDENRALHELVEFANMITKTADAVVDSILVDAEREIGKLPSAETGAHAEKISRLKLIGAEAKAVLASFKEGISMYMRLIVFGGLVLVTPGERLPESKPFADMVRRARAEMQADGITTEQRRSYVPVVNDAIRKAITPVGYQQHHLTFESITKNLFKENREEAHEWREDAWRLYLGIPQLYDTFGISDFHPESDKSGNYYYRINNFFQNYLSHHSMGKYYEADGLRKNRGEVKVTVMPGTYPVAKLIQGIVEASKTSAGPDGRPIWIYDTDVVAGIMGTFGWRAGRDNRGEYIEYDDRWDFDKIPIEKDGFFGKPFNIYDRLYYHPVTFEPLGLGDEVEWNRPFAPELRLREKK